MTPLQLATHHTRTAIYQYEQAEILFAHEKKLKSRYQNSRAMYARRDAIRYLEDANWHNKQSQRYYSKVTRQ